MVVVVEEESGFEVGVAEVVAVGFGFGFDFELGSGLGIIVDAHGGRVCRLADLFCKVLMVLPGLVVGRWREEEEEEEVGILIVGRLVCEREE